MVGGCEREPHTAVQPASVCAPHHPHAPPHTKDGFKKKDHESTSCYHTANGFSPASPVRSHQPKPPLPSTKQAATSGLARNPTSIMSFQKTQRKFFFWTAILSFVCGKTHPTFTHPAPHPRIDQTLLRSFRYQPYSSSGPISKCLSVCSREERCSVGVPRLRWPLVRL
jgi:hypothetical protein